MFISTLKSIKGRWFRFFSTSLAVVLAVAFLCGVLIFTDTVERSFGDLFGTAYKDTDAAVRSSEVINPGFGISEREFIDDSVVADLLEIPGVAAVGSQVEGFAQVSDTSGEPIGNPGQGPPALGFAWVEVDELNPWEFVEGNAPADSSEVVIDKATVDKGGFSLGDMVSIQTVSGVADYTLAGIVSFGSVDSPGGASVALFDLDTAQNLFQAEGSLSLASIAAEDGVDQKVLTTRIDAVLDDSYEVLTGEELIEDSQSEVADSLSFLTIFLSVFAAIAVFVASFVIYNVFAVLMAQRKKELALYRTIGATRRQVLGSIFVEAGMVGLVGSVLGIFLGVGTSYGLRALLAMLGVTLPKGSLVLSPRTIFLGLIVGIAVTLLSALIPSLKASRVSPLEAIRDAVVESRGVSKKRLFVGVVVSSVGFVGFLYGLLKPILPLFGLGAAVLFVGIFILGPILTPVVAKGVGSVVSRRGVTGEIAKGNALRNPKRTARTASALMIGVTLVTAVTVLSSSFKASIDETVSGQFLGDFVITPSSGGGPGVGVSPQLVADLEKADAVDFAAGVGFALAKVGTDGELDEGADDFGSVMDPSRIFKLLNIDVLEGDAELLAENSILIFSGKAEGLGVGIGDTVTVKVSGVDQAELEVVGIYGDPSFASNFVLSTEFYKNASVPPLNFITYGKVSAASSLVESRPVLDEIVAVYPNAELNDKAEFVASQGEQLDQFVNIIYAMLALAVLIAVFGIGITMMLSLLERKSEIGLLRAVGATRRQTRSIIRFESVITAIFGSLQGVLIGIVFGYAVIYALREQGVAAFSVSWIAIVVILSLACLFGIVASVIPARKASKLNILDAIASE